MQNAEKMSKITLHTLQPYLVLNDTIVIRVYDENMLNLRFSC